MTISQWLQKQEDWYPLAVFSILGFVSGLPFALVTTTFQAWLATEQLSVATVSLFSLVSIPYAMKPIWAIGIDWLRVRSGITSRVIYLFAVVIFAITMNMVSSCGHSDHYTLAWLILGGCFASATIDICVDAMRIIMVSPASQGLVSAWFVIFYRVAFILSGGMSLVIVDQIAWQGLYQGMSILAFSVGMLGYLMSLRLIEKVHQSLAPQSDNFFTIVYRWFCAAHKEIVSALLFIFIYKFHGNFLSSLLQVYLINDAKMSLAFIGFTYKTGGMLATFLGGLLAGYMSKHFPLRRGIQLTIFLQAVATGLFISVFASQLASESHTLITLAMYMESLSLGTSTTLITIIITKNCQAELAATQYAFFTAAIAWQRSLITPFSGWVYTQFGWGGYFATSLLLLPLVVIMLEKNAVSMSAAKRQPVIENV